MNAKRSAAQEPTLVVLLHAYTHDAARLEAVARVIRTRWPAAHLHRPELPASLFSMADPDDVVATVLEEVDALVAAAQRASRPFARIVLVGHSLGALLVRKLYVVACGETAEAPFEDAYRRAASGAGPGLVPARAWAEKVSRIVLLAGMNRGWRVSHHLSLSHAPAWWLGSAVCHGIHLVTGRWPLIFTIRRGARFITQLRIQWLHMRRKARAEGAGEALTIQLLGSRDDMVAPADNVDLVSGGDFVYLDVPFSGHADVIEVDDPHAGAGRRRALLLALDGSDTELSAEAVVPSDERFLAPDPAVKRLVFVVHGIRDAGYWTHKIARRIKQRAGTGRSAWATETSSYGYFPMLPFLFPWYRRRKVEWLMDQYTEALSRYPEASISYVGHSNGTYLLAKALEVYPCCRFEHVVFAGSVVRRRFDWRRYMRGERPRVKAVLNFVASADWVVAFFPKLFELLGVQDLGSAGHDGFLVDEEAPGVVQVRYVRGGHGAAIQEPVWDVIADFVITGRAPAATVPGRAREREALVAWLGRFPPLVWAAAALLVFALWLGIEAVLRVIFDEPSARAFATGFALAAYLLALWLVLTRV